MKSLDKFIKPKSKPVDDVPPGQLYLDDDENVTEFHQSREDVDANKLFRSDETFDKHEQKAELIDLEFRQRPALLKLKNRKEREEFINDEKNFPILVLKNDELGLTVKRLDFANGAILYRTESYEYLPWLKSLSKRLRFNLVDDSDRERPKTATSCTDYSCKCYTLDGTALGYVVDYMTKYKDEI